MMRIVLNLEGPMACGKTRATNAIQEALKEALPDKEYEVLWRHQIGTESTERGAFNNEGVILEPTSFMKGN